MRKAKMDKGAQYCLIVKEGNYMKSKTKNKPKTEKQTNQTKNKGKKEWKQR
jgi:hypothetical protein